MKQAFATVTIFPHALKNVRASPPLASGGLGKVLMADFSAFILLNFFVLKFYCIIDFYRCTPYTCIMDMR